MDIVNLTPHDVLVVDDNNKVLMNIPTTDLVARLKTAPVVVGKVNGIPLVKHKCISFINLPDPNPGTMFLVSSLIQQFSSRGDLIAPDTGPSCVRDKDRNVMAIRQFKSR